MYRLPRDIMKHLREKFPNIPDLDNLIHAMFEEIREKSLDDGACQIHSFGTFYTYKAYSSRKGVFTPRFKFRTSRTFLKIIEEDEYTLQRIEKVARRLYKGAKKARVEESIDEEENKRQVAEIRDINVENQNRVLNNQRQIRQKTTENLIQDEIAKILSEDFEEKESD